jgi:hypothetical protein
VKNTNQSCNGQKSESKSTFWAPMDNWMCHNESKVELKFEKYYFSQMPHRTESPHVSPMCL